MDRNMHFQNDTPDQDDSGPNLIESTICQRVKWMLEIRDEQNN